MWFIAGFRRKIGHLLSNFVIFFTFSRCFMFSLIISRKNFKFMIYWNELFIHLMSHSTVGVIAASPRRTPGASTSAHWSVCPPANDKNSQRERSGSCSRLCLDIGWRQPPLILVLISAWDPPRPHQHLQYPPWILGRHRIVPFLFASRTL